MKVGELTVPSAQASRKDTDAYLRTLTRVLNSNYRLLSEPLDALIEREDWRDASLQGTWVAFGAAYPSARFRLTGATHVELCGSIKNESAVAAGEVLFSMPKGYYNPDQALLFSTAGIIDSGSGVTSRPVQLELSITGDVLWRTGALLTATLVNIEGVSIAVPQV